MKIHHEGKNMPQNTILTLTQFQNGVLPFPRHEPWRRSLPASGGGDSLTEQQLASVVTQWLTHTLNPENSFGA